MELYNKVKKTFKTHDIREHKHQQHCPICNRYVAYSDRYPNYVCSKCESLTVDKMGLKVGFFNITLDGHGCQGKYLDSGKLYRSTKCFIKNIQCKAEEAYLGGIIIRPFKRNRNRSSALDPELLTCKQIP
ncbi:hypothetical protein [Mucilaginibacter sp. KACC 22063]|uniref:hypothetical protein n=1 Tax=Mucilaginibacter sp. KACC 22063 TaxID=3025666 RepID=UPI002366FD21|nr:hypothetical protein [Mucilaginibacter sp. KACC 22063]WDF55256.1 hypothetical protein PQ461_20190 [Mucilaginibacter sp. KACC 22063]